jgi:hypothetical protein
MALVVALAGTAAPAAAATVVFDSPGVASEVQGLLVASTTYDVAFTGAFSGSEWLNAPPRDFATESAASTAASGLAAELNGAGVTSLKLNDANVTVVFVQIPYSSFVDPNDNLQKLLSASLFYNGSAWVTGLANGTEVATNNFPFTADFTVVPVPAALPLMVTALAGLGAIGWRRWRQTAAA